MTAASPSPTRRAEIAPADIITLLRIPLAVIFPLTSSVPVRLAVLALAVLTDLGDGWVARRYGSSRIGVVIDPIADKVFTILAFTAVLISGQLMWYEVLAVLARDIIAATAYAITAVRGIPTAVPSRPGGKILTILQLLTLLFWVLALPHLQPLAWITGAAGLYAIYDYYHLFFRKLRAQ